ncbi:tetratricopeptide repeat protein [Sandaracinus amylolyticus]|uniref:Proline-rich protein n=1 Tax=Sandaracinus amylolyticus TaxID=927083 RepID=A0A0F6W592_9BACT|nr:tetratricopeptide repeat protein [Sandaracinus amylolyticus]AKF07627.1 Proline-rich protein [Sandaracinus amylolyticus]
MDVTCERCGTEYEFDETLVAARGTTVKCTNCGHLFKVFRPGAAAASSAPGDARVWTIRRAGGGPSESIASLKELQRRITLGQLTPDDEISRSGEGWKRLGDIAELQTFFAAAHAGRGERRDATGTQRREPTGASATRREPAGREPAGREPTGREPTGREPTGREPTGRQPTGRGDDRRAYAPTMEMAGPAPSAPPAGRGQGAGKSTMLGMGGASAPPPRPSSQPLPAVDEIKGRTLEMAVPPPAGAPTPSQAPRSGSASAPRPVSDAHATTPGGARAPSARPPAPPRAAPPTSRPPAPTLGATTPAPLPPPPHAPASPSTPAPRTATPTPSGEKRPSFRPLHVDEDDDQPARPRARSRSGLWVALVVLLAIGGGVAAGWDGIAALLGGGEEADRAAPFVAAGDEALRLDHEDAYDDAIAHYTKALAFREHDARALTGLSRAHALIAQQHTFDAIDLEARAEADATLRGEAATLRRDAREHAEDAREHAEAAARHGAGDADAEIALSDALRLAGDPTLSRSRLDRARTLRSAPSAEGLRVEALLVADQAGAIAAARPLAERAIAEDPGLVRARLLLARAHLAAGDVSAAQLQLQAVLDRVPEHPIATAMRAAIDAGRPPAAPVVASADAGTPVAVAPPPTPTPPPPTTTTSTPPPTPTVASPPTTPAEPAMPRGYDALVREAEQRLENGDTRRARALYEQALRERAGPEASAGLGFVMLAEGNVRGALTQLETAADRGYADALIGVGDAHRRLNQREQALSAYERYLERAPNGSRASIARRQADRLRTELGASSAPEPTPTPQPTPEPSEPAPDTTPTTAPDELPGPRGSTAPPPSDVPAIDSEP